MKRAAACIGIYLLVTASTLAQTDFDEPYQDPFQSSRNVVPPLQQRPLFGPPPSPQAPAVQGFGQPFPQPPSTAAEYTARQMPVGDEASVARASQEPVSPERTLVESAKVIAMVGDQPILAGDISPEVSQMMEPHLDEIPKDQIDKQRELLMKQLLNRSVESKLLYLDFLRSIPLDKRQEALTNVFAKVNEQFDADELPKAIKKAKVADARELDEQLRRYGSSLAKQRRLYAERMLGRSAVGRYIDYDVEITHDQMLQVYRENIADYERPARVRFEILSARFEDNNFDEQATWRLAGEMGNAVLGGAKFAEVAKRRSQGSRAEQGGRYDWTTEGSLASKPIDEAIFSLPVGVLSQRLRDDRGFHIVRVIEREEAGRVPFVEAQVEIKKKLKQDHIQAQVVEYLANLKEHIPVQTIYDAETQTATKPDATPTLK